MPRTLARRRRWPARKQPTYSRNTYATVANAATDYNLKLIENFPYQHSRSKLFIMSMSRAEV